MFWPATGISWRRSTRAHFALRACLACATVLATTLCRARDPFTPLSAQERAALYAELEQEVQALNAAHSALKTVVKLTSPTVVHIEWKSGGKYSTRGGRSRETEEAGSGVIIKPQDKPYVITNWHVLRDAELPAVQIRLDDGRQLTATKILHDPATDIAVVEIAESDVIPARLGDSSLVEIGDHVIAVGSPFGLSHSVTYGIISAKGRRQLELGDEGLRFQDFLQTDAAINPGNSGGPLISIRGEVIGINTAIASNSGGNEGIGFSIPINMAMAVVKQLIEHGQVNRAFLGVNLDRKFDAAQAQRLGLHAPHGARVISVLPGSAAQRAKMQVDDVILEFNHAPVEDDRHLQNIVSLTEVGRDVPVTVWREQREIILTVRLGDRSDYDQPTGQIPAGSSLPEKALVGEHDQIWDIDVLGVSVVELNPEIARRMRLTDWDEGLLVTQVGGDGPAAGQITAGEVLAEIEGQVLRRIDDLERALTKANLQHELALRVITRPSQDTPPAVRAVRLQPRLGTLN